MKHVSVSFVLIGLAVICASHEFTTKPDKPEKPCIMIRCSDVDEPVCGKQKVDDCWEEKIFRNNCYMLSANSCGKANYVRCVENQCNKSTTPSCK